MRRDELVTLEFLDFLAQRERRELLRMPWWEPKENLALQVCLDPLDQREKLVTLVSLVLQDHREKRGSVVHQETRDPWAQGAPKESLGRMK